MSKVFKLKVLIPALLGLGASLAHAQNPNPVRIIIGFAAGGNGDIIARMLANELRPILGRNVIVENKPGAGGRLAALQLKSAPADGSNYLLAPDSWSIFPTILQTEGQLRYSLQKDFAPVARVVSYPLGLFVSEGAGVHNLKEYIEKAKTNPSIAAYGSSGAGSITEFLGIVMSKEFGFKMTVIPFKGGSEVKSNLMGSQIPVGIMTAGDGLADVGGKIKPLGFFTPTRWSIAPDVPTFKEQGYDIVNGGAFSAIWTSAKTPESERKKMEDALKQVLSKPDVQEKLSKIYVRSDFADGRTLGEQVGKLIQYWNPIVESSGIKATVN
ncbi:ABC transporter substrate-binding protein (plasmid) [Diaphorobacter sp. HDW4B]|uniref:tripartite tricarboxylate transporter substrate-binding protein n=1 Tax=Diaphorobacter sp. HDW4B TaxID=2714925 RepID=UPI00140AC8FB|nr:tripartite tricarboxylate transporter substrate-binding protein [Diaphorobacter sp. HDW4B]QIL73949.1 ABC transporter substrate-binding protein [Diaphorobacter sp. HDW4B]